MNQKCLNIRNITLLINKRKNISKIEDISIDDSFYDIDNIVRTNTDYTLKYSENNSFINVMKSFIFNKRYNDFKMYFKYLINYKDSNIRYKNMIESCIDLILSLDTEVIFNNFNFISSDLISNIINIDEFNEKYSTFNEWVEIVDKCCYSIIKNIKNKDNDISNHIYEVYSILVDNYIKFFGELDENYNFLKFIFNSLMYYFDSKNLIYLIIDNITKIFYKMYEISYCNFINLSLNTNKISGSNYIYIIDDILGNIESYEIDILNRVINYEESISFINYIKENDYYIIEYSDINNIKRFIKRSIYYLNNVIIKNDQSALISSELLNIKNKIIDSTEISNSVKKGIFLLNLDNIYLNKYSKYVYFIKAFILQCKLSFYDYNNILLDNILSKENHNAIEVSLVDYIKKYLSYINVTFLEFCAYNNDISMSLLNFDNNHRYSIIEFIDDFGNICIPFATSFDYTDEIINVVDESKFKIFKFNFIYYIIDKRFKICKSDINKIRNLDIEYSLITPNILMIESMCNMIEELNNDYLIESKLTNKLKIWKDSLKVKINQARDKEVKISNNIDNIASKLQDDIKVAFTSKNREAIIKGRLIPSLSQLIKICVATGAIAYFINPIAGALSFLGAMAISSKATKQERKIILDEIEIKIKLMDKKISKAEAEDNMEDYENYLKIKKVLETEKKKILYKTDDYTKLDKYKSNDD